MEVAARYKRRFPTAIKEEVERTENLVREKHGNTSSNNIDAELMDWIPDKGFSWSKDAKYFKLVELYWYNKSFIVQVVEEHGVQQQGILDKLDFLDRKYEALVKTIWGTEAMEGEPNQDSQAPTTEDRTDTNTVYIHVDSDSEAKD